MLSRIKLFRGLTPFTRLQKASTLFKPSLPTLTSFYHKPQRKFCEGYLQDYSEYTFAKKIMQSFVSKKTPSPHDIAETLHQLERYRIGVSAEESLYKSFITVLTNSLRINASPKEIQFITEKARSIRIKDKKFWDKMYEILKTSKIESDPKAFISIANTLIRIKAYPDFINYVREKLIECRYKIESSMYQLDTTTVARACYIFYHYDMLPQSLVDKLKSDLWDNMPNLDMVLSADDLAIVSLVTSTVIDENDPEKDRLMRELSQHFVSRDLLEYDLSLQHYEYDDPSPGETGVRDRLKWESIAFMARTFAVEKYYNEMLIDRMKEAIYRKSETDIIDFENAAIILSVYARLQDRTQNDFYLRILEMVHLQLINEGPSMFAEFDGKNIGFFLDAITRIFNYEFDRGIVDDCFNYFAELIINDQISSKIKLEDYKSLKHVFTTGKKFARFDEGVFSKIDEKIGLLEN